MAFDITGYRVWKVPIAYTFGSALTGFKAVITGDVFGAGHDIWTVSQNGGGDLRVALDDGGVTQYPLHVCSWNTSTKSGRLEFRIPSVDTGGYVHVYAYGAGPTQPAVDAAFGRNEVNQDLAIAALLDDTSGSVAVDSSGNRDGIYNGSLPTPGADFGQDLDGSADYVDFGNTSLGIASAFTFSLVIKPDVTNIYQMLFCADDSTASRNWQWRIDIGGAVRIIPFDSSGAVICNAVGPNTVSANAVHILHFVWDGTAYKSYIDGIEDYSFFTTKQIKDLSGVGFGALIGRRKGTSGDYLNGQAGNLNVLAGSFRSPDYIAAESAINLSPTTFWGTPVEVTASGGTTQTVAVITATEQEYAQALTLSQNQTANVITAEDIEYSLSLSLSVSQVAQVITAQDKEVAQLLTISQSQTIASVVAQDNEYASLLSIAEQATIATSVAHEIEVAGLLDVSTLQALSLAIAEEREVALPISVDITRDQIVTLIVAQENEVAQLLAISLSQPVPTFTATDSEVAQLVNASLTQQLFLVSAIDQEYASLIDIIQAVTGIDLTGLVLVPVTQRYTLEPQNTPAYTLEPINQSIYTLEKVQ